MRVAVTYVVVAWIIIQVAATTFSGFGIPDWAFRFVVLMLLLGFPVAIILAWAFELTPDGVKLTKNVASAEKSATFQSKRNWMVVGLAAALPTVIFGSLAVFFYFNQSGESTGAGEPPAISESEAASLVADAVALEELNKSIAVLPFENRSSNTDDAYFTDGIHDDLLTRHILAVMPRTGRQVYHEVQVLRGQDFDGVKTIEGSWNQR